MFSTNAVFPTDGLAARMVLQILYILDGLVDDRADLLHILLDIVLDGGEDLGLGHVDEVIYIGRIIV